MELFGRAANRTSLAWDAGWNYSSGKDPYGYPVGAITYDETGHPIEYNNGYDEKTVWGPFETILPIVSGISIFLSILTIAAYFLIRKYMPQVANRVSLRLVALIALADIAYNSTWFSMEFYFTEMKGTRCQITGFFMIWSGLASTFITFAIGVNIFLVFVLKLGPTKSFEKIYISACIIVALVLSLVAVSAGKFGYNSVECWFTGNTPTEVLANAWIFFYGWILASCAACSLFVIMFYFVLRTNQRTLERMAVQSGGASQTGTTAKGIRKEKKKQNLKQQMINRTVGRISWYCIVPILAQSGNLIYDIMNRKGAFDFWCIQTSCIVASYFTIFLAALQGTFNALIFFFCDPTVSHACKSFRLILVKQYYIPYIPATEAESYQLHAHFSGISMSPVASQQGTLFRPSNDSGEMLIERGPETLWRKFMFWYVRTFLVTKEGGQKDARKADVSESFSGITNGMETSVETDEKAEAVAFL